jgi:hypothetical protein
MRYYDELDGSRLGNLKPTADMISIWSWNDELIVNKLFWPHAVMPEIDIFSPIP